jgi:hypothetical protein
MRFIDACLPDARENSDNPELPQATYHRPGAILLDAGRGLLAGKHRWIAFSQLLWA